MESIENAIDAVYRKEYSSLCEILERVGIDATDGDGRTALMHAVLDDDADKETVALLLKQGANVNLQDSGQKWSALHFAARDQKTEIVKVLLESGAEVDLADSFGNTPLWRCVMSCQGKTETIGALLEYGADPNKKNAHGFSALDTATIMGNTELQAILSAR